MPQSKVHTVILVRDYADHNYSWLHRFVQHAEDKAVYFFACHNIYESHAGLLKFEGVWLPASEEKADILLPSHAVAGIFLDQTHKNQFGLFHPDQSLEQ